MLKVLEYMKCGIASLSKDVVDYALIAVILVLILLQ